MPHMDQPLQPYVDADGTIKVKPAQFDAEGELIPDPSWEKFVKRYLGQDRELIFENLPFQLNLGPESTLNTMGWAKGYRDKETGETVLEIALNEDAAIGLDQLVEVYELKAIGFAGIKKRQPGDGR
jgi:hypothetical protein